jgi:hypothetical protein
MPYYRVGGLMVHINLGGKARKNPPKACPFYLRTKAGELVRCLQMAPYLCDWPGCDVPICETTRCTWARISMFAHTTTTSAACSPGCCQHLKD